jgi:hypothetical protein
MLRLICPKCRKNSYSAAVESFGACPYCGSVFSGRYGAEKREERRIEREIPFVFSYQGQNLKASTFDLSKKGLGIKIFSESSVAVGDTIDLFINDLHIRAKVMWTRRLPDKSMAGVMVARKLPDEFMAGLDN